MSKQVGWGRAVGTPVVGLPWGLETRMCVGGLERWVVWLGADCEGCMVLVQGSGCGASPAWVGILYPLFPTSGTLDKRVLPRVLLTPLENGEDVPCGELVFPEFISIPVRKQQQQKLDPRCQPLSSTLSTK